MTDRKLFGLFSGAQITFMVCIAIAAPSAVYATATATAVVITEPGSGKQSYIDSSRRLYTYDPIAGYASNPANIVNISVAPNANTTTGIYTVPAGKALIIKSATISYRQGTQGYDNRCVIFVQYNIIQMDDTNVAAVHSFNFESGIIVASNKTLSVFATPYANIYIQGYLVPSNAVPAAGTQEAAEQLVSVGTPAPK